MADGVRFKPEIDSMNSFPATYMNIEALCIIFKQEACKQKEVGSRPPIWSVHSILESLLLSRLFCQDSLPDMKLVFICMPPCAHHPQYPNLLSL